MSSSAWLVASLVLGRVAFGFQFQSVASMGPSLAQQYGLDYAGLGTLIGLFMAPGIVAALPGGMLGRRLGGRALVGSGFVLMTLGGLLAAVAPIERVIYLDAASFLISAGSLNLVRRGFNGGERANRSSTVRADILEGLRYVLGHPVLRNISAMMALVNFVGATIFAQLVFFAKHHLEASNALIGLLFSAGSGGVIVLSLAAGPIVSRNTKLVRA